MTTDRDRCVGVATSTVDTSSTGSETLMRRSASDSITATVPPPTTPFKTYGSLDSSLRDYATAMRVSAVYSSEDTSASSIPLSEPG